MMCLAYWQSYPPAKNELHLIIFDHCHHHCNLVVAFNSIKEPLLSCSLMILSAATNCKNHWLSFFLRPAPPWPLPLAPQSRPCSVHRRAWTGLCGWFWCWCWSWWSWLSWCWWWWWCSRQWWLSLQVMAGEAAAVSPSTVHVAISRCEPLFCLKMLLCIVTVVIKLLVLTIFHEQHVRLKVLWPPSASLRGCERRRQATRLSSELLLRWAFFVSVLSIVCDCPVHLGTPIEVSVYSECWVLSVIVQSIWELLLRWASIVYFNS